MTFKFENLMEGIYLDHVVVRRIIRIKIYVDMYNFACSLYGRETWSLTLREEHGLKVFENRMLRKIFRPKRDEIIGGWENCIMRTFITLNSSPNTIRMIE
jgi:hypothetical protein